MPSNFRKPGQNASNFEVTEFMTNKYVHKKWVDENWGNDPAWLFENKQKKFQKFVQYYAESQGQPAPEFKQQQDEAPKKQSVGISQPPKSVNAKPV